MRNETLKEAPVRISKNSDAKDNKPSRSFNLDIIRILALCCVVGVHFFLNGGYYENTVSTLPMNIMSLMRTLFMICVPLFLLLTGYLQGSKELIPCKQYYFKLTNVIGPYLIIMLFDMLFCIIIKEKVYTTREVVENFTLFTNYSWYVNMYIGLFLLIPFLNIIWHKLSEKKQEYTLIIILIILSILPNSINAYEFDAQNWWNTSNNHYWYIFPYWWDNIYPITYYYIGAYLCRHKSEIKIKPIYAFLIFLGCFAVFGAYAISQAQDITFSVYSWTNYNNIGILAIALSVFIFINSINFSRVPAFLRKIVAKLSDLSFGAYLGSWACDQLLYPILKDRIPIMDKRLWVFPIAVLIILTGAYIISFGADITYKLIAAIFKCFGKRRTKSN